MNEHAPYAHGEHPHAGEATNPLKASLPVELLEQVRAAPKHPEAFKLMLYVGDDGETIETIWNSRDGVSPFVVGARVPEGERSECRMTHQLWGGDPSAPFHVPNIGDRIFVTLTKEIAREQCGRYVERCWEEDKLAEDFESKEAAVAHLVEESLRQPGQPTIVTVDAALQRKFLERRREIGDALLAEKAREREAAMRVELPKGTPPHFNVGGRFA